MTDAGGDLADRAFSATAEAYVQTSAGWTHAVRAGLTALFRFLAANATEVGPCIDQQSRSGLDGLDRRDALLTRFAELLAPGYVEGSRRPPAVVAEAISGSVFELIHIHAAEGRLDELPDAVPAATAIALTPFVGSDEAERLALGPTPLRR